MKKKNDRDNKGTPSSSVGRRPNASAIARETELSRQYVSRLLKQGHTGQQIIDQQRQRQQSRERAVREQKRQRTAAANGASPESRAPAESYSEAQRRKEVSLADLRQIEVLEKRGELIQFARANFALGSVAIGVRQALEPLELEIGDFVRHNPHDPIAIETRVRKAVNAALNRIADFGLLVGSVIPSTPAMPPAVRAALTTVAKYICALELEKENGQ